MTVLSDSQILKSLKKGEIKLEPNDLSTCLNPAGYDLRSLKTVTIKPKEYELVATLETVELDLNIVAFMHIRSSLAREGIIGSFAVIDPGFRGQVPRSATLSPHHRCQCQVSPSALPAYLFQPMRMQ